MNNKFAVLAAIFAVVVVLVNADSGSVRRKVLSNRHPSLTPKLWSPKEAAHPQIALEFTLALKQRNLPLLQKVFEDVSDPRSKHYGKFLEKIELDRLIAPSQKAVQVIEKWLKAAGVEYYTMEADYVRVFSTVKVAEKLFHTQFAVYHKSGSDATLIRHTGTLSVPQEVAPHIELVLGLSEFFEDTHYKPLLHDLRKSQFGAGDPTVTPDLLRSFYNVPSDLVASSKNTTQAIAAFTDYFSIGALREFEKHFDLSQVDIHASGPDCLPDCDQGESDLDVQYVTAMGRGVDTSFLNHKANYWILEWAQQLSSMDQAPLVNSVSYGFAELEQCAIAQEVCPKLGYDSAQYVARTNTELQKLGTRGATILVSDGDDGAPSLGGATGNCPIDTKRYCPVGGCEHSTTSCGMATITTNDGTNTTCYFPMGIGSDDCQKILRDQSAVYALEYFLQDNYQCNANLEQDSRKGYHIYSECSCGQMTPYKGDQYNVEGYQFSQSGGRPLTPDYPTSSPYVTSVGATQFMGSSGHYAELPATIVNNSLITTGGGFAVTQSMPSYQSSFVKKYLQSGVPLPPSFTYNPNNRAYPDLAFNGHNYEIYMSTQGDQCPCQSTKVDGTSCSSPAFAGLVSLINDKLLQAQKSPLGFLNYLLYQMAEEHPAAFNDIVSGDNKCNRQYCCTLGYEATYGWDPVTGLGSPNFDEMLNYILKKKGVN